ncbi:hypothetical protein BWQ96_10060 [Gracilariopsis chorda]|uniref:C2H2-type domain-containing protein n=1 Tax=Gracilariopsis chorda TaxID=448386 RepID=A0A2V3IDU4_9FLOR|nr:hypothetical protein BWQ96_10060 [Gracilariopsis chorda]|eukprot:PXF40222.1 hypothetical protein BWQ96_10060 [Gracilariopsis chorda]
MPVPRTENRQARLDAAIALFRSEASASGYVVEEVRLRLPVPDVDVMPRVIIAQNNAGAATPPPFPRSKQHRAMPAYPYGHGPDHMQIPATETYSTSTGIAFAIPPKTVTSSVSPYRNGKGESNGGVKRTVSGSVVFHPIQPKTVAPRQGTTPPPTSSVHTENKEGESVSAQKAVGEKMNGQHATGVGSGGSANGKFWKTVIGGDKGRAILKAAESMQRMRHGMVGSRAMDDSGKTMKGVTQTQPPTTSVKGEAGVDTKRHLSPAKKRKSDNSKDNEEEAGETTLHINGHSIPESHVQLLLSSAADISAREEERKRSSGSSTEHTGIHMEEKRSKSPPSRAIAPKLKPAVTHTKQVSSRNRKDGSERSTSRSSAARPFKCTRCPSSFDRDGHLRVHILAVHEKKRPFVCQVCDASFGHSSSLLRHVRTVHQASPAIGSGKSGSRNGNRNSDSRVHSDDNDEDEIDDSKKHFRCSVCAQAFDRVALLNRHVANKHPLKSERL